MGLVSRVVPDEELWDTALATATTVAGYTSYGLRNTKEVMWHNLDTNSMAAAIALENRNQDLGNRTEEVIAYMREDLCAGEPLGTVEISADSAGL